MPTGRSSSLSTILLSVERMERMMASAETNSVYTMAAPKRLQSMRNPISVTSSIGARNRGRFPKSMFPIFMIFLFE